MTNYPYRSQDTNKYLIGRDDDFEQDQHNDDDIEAERALGADDIGERLRGFRDHRELAVECLGALLELVLVLEPGVKPLEIRTVPQHVGLFRHRDTSGHAM